MASFNKFSDFKNKLLNGNHNFQTDSFKIALTNTAPSISNTLFSDIVEITAGNGYTAGGSETTISLVDSSNVISVQGTEVVFSATSGSIGPFRYAVLYNATNNNLIGWWDYGLSLTLIKTKTFAVKFNNASPGTILTIS